MKTFKNIREHSRTFVVYPSFFLIIVFLLQLYQVNAQQRKWDGYGKSTLLSVQNNQIEVCPVRIGPEKTGIWGVIDLKTKEVLVEPKYDYVGKFEIFGVANVKLGDKFGFINWQGTEITPIQYDKPNPNYNEGSFLGPLALVRKGGEHDGSIIKGQKFGYINKKGEEVIPPKFAYARKFQKIGNSGTYLATVYTGECEIDDWDLTATSFSMLKCALIDTIGRYIITPGKYKQITFGNNDDILVEKENGTYDILNSKGKMLYSTQFMNIESLSDKYYKVSKQKQSEYGVLNSELKIIIPAKYSRLIRVRFDDGYILFTAWNSDDNEVYFFTEQGNLLTNKTYYTIKKFGDSSLDNPYIFNNGWDMDLEVVIDKNEQYGFINREGKEVIECKFFCAENFNHKTGLAVVINSSNKKGAIDTTGRLVIPIKYDDLNNKTQDGYIYGSIRKQGSDKSIIVTLDKNGNEISVK